MQDYVYYLHCRRPQGIKMWSRFAKCIECRERIGGNLDYSIYDIYRPDKKVGQLYIHHKCFSEGAKHIGEQVAETTDFSHITVTTKIGRKKFEYSMQWKYDRYVFVKTFEEINEMSAYKNTFKFYKQYMAEDDVWIFYYRSLASTNVAGIPLLAHIGNADSDLKQLTTNMEHRSKLDDASKKYDRDISTREGDALEEYNIMERYIDDTAGHL